MLLSRCFCCFWRSVACRLLSALELHVDQIVSRSLYVSLLRSLKERARVIKYFALSIFISEASFATVCMCAYLCLLHFHIQYMQIQMFDSDKHNCLKYFRNTRTHTHTHRIHTFSCIVLNFFFEFMFYYINKLFINFTKQLRYVGGQLWNMFSSNKNYTYNV